MNYLIVKLQLVLATCLVIVGTNAIAAEQKHIVIYGSTGKAGSNIVVEALARGHKITAVTRDLKRIKEKFKIDGPVADNFFPVQSDITDIDLVSKTISGADVVFVAVGYSGSPDNDPVKTVQYKAAKNLIEVARQLGDSAPRIIQFAGTSTLQYRDGYYRDLYPPSKKSSQVGTKEYANSYGHFLAVELYKSVPDVNWTIFSPNLTGVNKRGVRTGNFKTSIAKIEFEIDNSKEFNEFEHLLPLSWEDFGVAIVNEIETPQYIRGHFTAHY